MKKDKRKSYKIVFQKKEVREGSSGSFLPSDLLYNSIMDFCRSSWIDIEQLSVNNFPKKSFIKVNCTEKLYNLLLNHFKTSNLAHWVDVIK